MSIPKNLKKVMKEGWKIFWRKKFATSGAILMTSIVLLFLGILLLFNTLLSFSMAQLQERVDVNIYFFPEVGQERIFTLESKIKTLPVVKEVQYISRTEAFEDFVETHKTDYLILQSLDELNVNPLGASLNIKTYTPDQYEILIDFIEKDDSYTSIIEKVNYYQNEEIINRLKSFIATMNSIGAAITLLLVIVSILIISTTTKFIVESLKDEINTKKLMGVSRKYLQGTFFFMGAIQVLISTIISIILLYPLTFWFGSKTETFFGGVNIFNYFAHNVFQIFILLLALGLMLMMISVAFALHKHLKK